MKGGMRTMRTKYLVLTVGIIVLLVAMTLPMGCQNQPTGPENITKMEGESLPASSKSRSTTTTSNWWGDGSWWGTSTTTTIRETTTTPPPPTTTYTTTSAGGDGANRIALRARGLDGTEHIYVAVGNDPIGDRTLYTTYVNYYLSTDNTGDITVCFDNDDGENRHVQIDYIEVNDERREAENQNSNTGVWQDESCGGEYSEMLHCEGCIVFGDTSPGSGGSGSSTSTAETTTSTGSSWWWVGGSWW
jgi:hypothetical protein